MSEEIEACACGNSEIMHQAISWRSIYFCHVCLRGGKGEATPAAAKRAWNADMRAIKAARDVKPEPEPPKNKVYAGKWHTKGCEILTSYGDDEDEHICNVTSPASEDYSDAPNVAVNTARLMAAAKEMHHKLAEGRVLYRDGYSSTSLSEFFCKVGALLDGLGVDVD